MERLTSFVSSRGILKSCRAHNKQPASSNTRIDADLISQHRPYSSIYICTDALRNFSDNFLPSIQTPFTLVSGDSDTPVSEVLLADPAIRGILEHEHLQAWHAQNLSASHPKLFQLPIGLDYHTMWERPGFWGITAVSPMAQENSLINTLASSPEFNQRYLTAYCNWHFAMDRGDRRECHEKVDKSACYFETSHVPRNSTWLRQAECMFVLSPEGAGMDCHRTWEAILLGCVPIVKRNPLAPLFAELPVMIVDDWTEVNRQSLLSYANAIQNQKFNFSSLFREFVNNRLEGKPVEGLPPPMTSLEFRKLLTRKTG